MKYAKPAVPRWPRDVHTVFRAAGIRQIAIVPDAGHSQLIELCEKDRTMKVVRLTTEEEGVALLAGAWLGGDRGALLMQSSGVGNCINMLTLSIACQLPLFMLVTMRGEAGEFNPAQIPMGSATQRVLEDMGAEVTRAESPDLVAQTVTGALQLAYNADRPVAVLIAQSVIGVKAFK